VLNAPHIKMPQQQNAGIIILRGEQKIEAVPQE
jgi:hypothetical protein